MKIRISLTIYLLAIAMTAMGFFLPFLSYLIATVLHEIAHASTAKRLGYTLNEFCLMPYGCALIGEFEQAKPSDEIRIAIAGPLCNLVMSVLCVAVWWLAPQSYPFTSTFVTANISLLIVNLLPVYPLDGGRIALGCLSQKTTRIKAYSSLRIVGLVVGIAFALLFVTSCFFGVNLSFASMSAFTLISTFFPDNKCYYQSLYRVAYRSKRVDRGLVVRNYLVKEDTLLKNLVKMLSPTYYSRFEVCDDNLSRVGVIEESALEKIQGEQMLISAKQFCKEMSKII
jgi:Zn-dependent protease